MENIQNKPNELAYPVHLYMVTEGIFVCSKNERMTRERLRNSVGIVMRMIYFHQFYQRTPLEVSEKWLSTPLFKQREQTPRGLFFVKNSLQNGRRIH